jgi:putative transposase
MVTASTHLKKHVFPGGERLRLLYDALLATALDFGWELQAWAVFPNHYHLVGVSPGDPQTLRLFLKALHGKTAREANKLDNTPGRAVWHQYRDTRLTHERSYFARLRYVHANAVHHKLVLTLAAYPWCSASRFETDAPPAFRQMIYGFPIDRLKIEDDF